MPLGTTENIIELAGNTLLLHLGRFCRPTRAEILRQAGSLNPLRLAKETLKTEDLKLKVGN